MKKVLSYTILLIALSLGSCKKYLEKLPDNRTEVTAAEQVTMLLTTAYPQANYITFAESMSDNAEDKEITGGEPENSHPFLFQDVLGATLDYPEMYWHSCYKAIAAANHALEVINSAKDTMAFRAQKGEALVARAYAHFMLATFFAKTYDPATAATDMGIPYVTQRETEVFGQYDRKTVAYVYEMIEKDLVEGLPLIDERIYKEAVKFHFNQKAAHAFASRFYLFKKDYAKVVSHSTQALSTNAGDDLRPWNTVYIALPYFELQAIYTRSSERANYLIQEANSIWGRSYASYRFGLGNKVFSVMRGQNVTGGQLTVAYNVYGSSPQFYNVPKFREHFVTPNLNADFGDPYNMIPLLTADETLFNRAEANVRVNNHAAALADLNVWASKNVTNYNPNAHNLTAKKVVDFYSMPSDTSGAIIRAVLDLKRIFFIHEGIRWFDILRHKIPVTHTTTDGLHVVLSANDNRRQLQLPAEVRLSGVPLNPR
jgi:hypothetical protein